MTKYNNKQFDELINIVIEQLKKQHYKESTLTVYKRTYRRIREYMEQQGIKEYSPEVGQVFLDLQEVQPSTFSAYSCAVRRLNDCYAGKEYRFHHANASEDICLEYQDLKQFLKYIQLSGEHVYLPIIPKVHEDYIPYLFTEEELHDIFDSADNIIQTDKKADPNLVMEFPVILRLLYSCGLRIGETVKLKMSDVDVTNGILRMLNTKGDKHRLVPMSDGMTDILQKYCMAMGLSKDDNDWLFPSYIHTGHISSTSVKCRFKKILNNHQIQLHNRKKYERGPCLHCFRHLFAFQSFAQAERAGRHLDDANPYLSIYLGHDRLDETSKYLKFSNELFPESIDIFGIYMEDLFPEVDYEA